MPLVTPALVALLTPVAADPDAAFRIGTLLYSDSGVTKVENGIFRLDVSAVATVWFRPELRGPVR